MGALIALINYLLTMFRVGIKLAMPSIHSTSHIYLPSGLRKSSEQPEDILAEIERKVC